ncbi:MAG: sugar ABC transporter substrate-binding protein [Actinobacteria bacterium]|nr:sugar ABC transporter substrate-binding protein [Actinomycetota bacterium]MBV8395548.1 sugar ABC transporter substrate-binding protein [Actinomycetota bacterium]MBV8599526.1 sugar ABC transporter substrate-binding protein [Actinomycetota bacterium]
MRSPRIAALTVGVVLALAATAVMAGSGAAKSTAGGKIKIGYINLSDQLPFVVIVRHSIEAAAKAAGVQLVECDSNLDAQKAINCAAQFKTEGVQGIANFQLDATAAPRVCAAGPNVPTVAIDIHQPPCEKVFFGANNKLAGQIDGQAVGQFAKSKWNCKADALLSLNAPTAGQVVVDRENGEISGFKQSCPSVKVIKVTTNATTDGSIQPFTDTLSRLPGAHHILVVATNDDQAIGAVKAAQSANRLGDIYVGAQGGDPTSWPYICGKTTFKNWIGDTAYFPQRYGQNIVPALVALVQGKKEPRYIYTKHQLLTPQNITSIYPTACK